MDFRQLGGRQAPQICIRASQQEYRAITKIFNPLVIIDFDAKPDESRQIQDQISDGES
jgi:hypothetical protein